MYLDAQCYSAVCGYSLIRKDAHLVSEVIDVLYARTGLLLQCKVAVCGVYQVIHHLPNQGRVAVFPCTGISQGIQLPLQRSSS